VTGQNHPKSPSLRKTRRRIEALKRLTLENADIDVLKEQLKPLLTGFRIRTPILNRGLELYRGVLWEDKPSTRSQLTYPPPEVITRYQRANRPGEPRFYCSAARSAPFFELHMSPGQRIALSKWRLRENLAVNNVGYASSVFARVKSTRTELPSWRGSDLLVDDTVNDLITTFFSEQFAQDITEGSEHLYKLSIAIAERHLGNIRGDIYGEKNVPVEKRFAGLI